MSETRKVLKERLLKLHQEARALCLDVMDAQPPGDEPRISLILAMEHLNNAKAQAEMGRL